MSNSIIITLIICITIVVCGIITTVYEYIKEHDNYSIHKNEFLIKSLQDKIEKNDNYYKEKIYDLYSKINGKDE